ncbi:MAG TPA: hypothetical protein VHP34_11840 [Alphaproteobacteria bacterium]|nr:hypothetical protein [Alphaproteobacteria bacterium]
MSQKQINRTPLSADFCSRTQERFVFEPETMHEAAFVAQQLQGMGFRYYQPGYADQLDKAVKGCIYLDTDNTIMVSESRRDEGLFCSVDDFPNFYIPENMFAAPARLTETDIANRTLVFYPRTAAEARGIYAALIARGATTAEEDLNATVFTAMAVTQGLFVKNGILAYAPQKEDLIGAEICTAADLGFNSASALSAEQITIMAAFNEMTARMQQMAARIERLEDEILPQKVEKRKSASKPKSLLRRS